MEMDVILIHGLSGSTTDMQPVADKLAGDGYRVFNVALPGHGTRPEDLLSINMQDWIGAGESQINACSQDIFIVGQSMGALLALHYAAKYPERIKGIALLSPAIRLYGGFNRLFMSLLYGYSLVLPVPHLYYTKVNGADIADPRAKKSYGAYNRIPLKALAEFEHLRRVVLNQLDKVISPALIIHSTGDHTIAEDAAEIIDSTIGSAVKKVILLKDSFHVISVDRDKENVANAVTGFLKKIDMGVK
jgi:carboxylesterase